MQNLTMPEKIARRRSVSLRKLTTTRSDMLPLEKEKFVLESMLLDCKNDLEELLAEQKDVKYFSVQEDWSYSVDDLRAEVEALKAELSANQTLIDDEEDELYDI